jgi:hypothetical protein
MNFTRLVTLSAGMIGCAALGAQADPAQFVGNWHWNKAESSLIQGEQPAQDILLNITDLSGGTLKWTLNAVDPAGQKHTESFDGKADGTPTAVTGAGDQTTASFTVAGDQLKAVFRSPDGGSDSWSCLLAPGGAKMSCKGTESDGHGHTANYTDVYDRS